MYLLLVPPTSTILSSTDQDESIEPGLTTIVWYTMDGYRCEKNIHITRDRSARNLQVFEVTTEIEKTPHIVSFLITNGMEWSEPYVGMRPIRYSTVEGLYEDKILSVKTVFIDEGYYYLEIPIGAVVNGYLAYPTHTSDGKMIDPVSKLPIL